MTLSQTVQRLRLTKKVLAKLTEIEEKVKTIKNDIAKANETKALIKAIGTVTLDSADAIKAARDSYDALENAEQKALVDNASRWRKHRHTRSG